MGSKVVIKHIGTGNEQQRYEKLSHSIKSLSLKCKVEDGLNETAINSSPKFGVSDRWTEIITQWFKADEYCKKHTDYKRLFKQITDNKEACDRWTLLDEDIKLNERKLQLISQLLILSNSIANNYSEKEEQLFRHVENELFHYLTRQDILILHASGVRLNTEPSLLEYYIKKLCLDLRRLSRKMRKGLTRDLRAFLRSIVRIHRTRNSDETDVDNLLLQHVLTRLFKLNLYHKWIINKEGNFFKIFATQQF